MDYYSNFNFLKKLNIMLIIIFLAIGKLATLVVNKWININTCEKKIINL